MMEAVLRGTPSKVREVNDQERLFCDGILSGMSQLDAVINAGYFPMDVKNDPKLSRKARNKAQDLLKKHGIILYMQKNKKKIYLTDDCDVPALKHHLYEIAMGNARGIEIDHKGNEHEVPPKMSDQIAAANAFLKYNESDRKYKLAGVKTMTDQQAKVQENKVQSLLSKYRTAEIVATRIYETHPEFNDDEAELLPVPTVVG